MKTIHLHGKIGKMFGEKWLLEVDSITEALRAIDANVGGLGQELENDSSG